MIEAETGVHIYKTTNDDPKQGDISQDDLLKIKIPGKSEVQNIAIESDNFIQKLFRSSETVTDLNLDLWFRQRPVLHICCG